MCHLGIILVPILVPLALAIKYYRLASIVLYACIQGGND